MLHRIGSDVHIGHRVQHPTDRYTPDRGAELLVQFGLAPYASKPCKSTAIIRTFLLRSNHPLPAWLFANAFGVAF
jgi:hypothetical protein